MNMILSRAFMMCAALLLISGSASSQSYSFGDPWGNEGISLIKSDPSEVQLVYSVHSFSLQQQPAGRGGESDVLLPGHFLGNDPGAPNLPGSGHYIAIPEGAEIFLEITGSRKERYLGMNIGPAPHLPFDIDNAQPVYVKDMSIYGKDALYPENPVKISGKFRMRGVDMVMLGVTPFQYNPVSGEFVLIRDIRITVRFEGGSGRFGDSRLRSRHWDALLDDFIMNADRLPEVDYGERIRDHNLSDATGCEYLIITPTGSDFLQWADTIKKFREQEGILTGIVTLAEVGGNTTSAIENYVNTAYNTWDIPPVAVLLMADYGTDPTNSITSFSYPHPYSGTYISDNTYADVDGDDLPEMFFARLAANNAAQLQVMIEKFIDYETNPPVDPGFYDHPITALGWQTTRWFQICSETVGGFFSNVLGKSPVRINEVYDGDPSVDPWSTASNTSTVLDYFGPFGLGYIPSSPATLGGWTGGTATDVNNAINSGSFILQHRDHGYEFGWGEPSYTNSNISGLTNTDLCFVMSINCLTGRFDYGSETFAEKFHRYTYGGNGAGALGLIAASQVSYSFVNDTYVWGFYDYLWPDFMPDYTSNPLPRGLNPCFANAAGKYYLQQSNWPYNTGDKQITYRLFHHHGDAFLNLFSEIPQPLTVSCDSIIRSDDTSFTVTADSGAFIAITYSGELISASQTDGNPCTLPVLATLIPGEYIKLTVTGRNYLRYSEDILIAPSEGPCVVVNDVTVVDTLFNSNGLLDYGESGSLDIEMINVGGATAANFWVVLSENDPWLSLCVDSVFVDSIQSSQTLLLGQPVGFALDSGVPDGHEAALDVIAKPGTSTWTSNELLPCHSPAFAASHYINDTLTGDQNGMADPGETVDLVLTIQNGGSCISDSVSVMISCAISGITFSCDSLKIGGIGCSGEGQAVFLMTVGTSVSLGTLAAIPVILEDDRGFTMNDTVELYIGRKPVLIVDLDPNTSSGPALTNAMANNGIISDYVNFIPANLAEYQSVFVHLGIYASNHVLSAAEGTQLAGYVSQGGNLYMEGGDTWAYDAQTDVHPMFKIDPIADGASDMVSLAGVAGTPLEGISIVYNGENSWMDRLGATDTAFVALNNTSPVYGTAVFFNGGAYRTIGCSHEFGGLTDGTDTKDQLAGEYLRFFGIPIYSEWLGNTGDWDDPQNWSNGLVPDAYTHVVIPASPLRGNFPSENRSGTMDCKTLTVEPGAQFQVPTGSVMHIHN